MSTDVKVKDGAADGPRKLPEIDPNLAQVNMSGQAFKHVFVRLPRDFIADDLKEPDIWRRIQATPRVALRKLDRVTAISWGEEWLVDVVVADANAVKVVLCTPQKTTLPARIDPLFSDENFAIKWDGAQYAVVRKRDGVVVAREPTIGLAERTLAAQYPRAAR